MALNIIEVVDVGSTGDDILEGLTKCKNNWEAISSELLVGYKRRSAFAFASTTTLTVGGGVYEVSGTLARITSSLTTAAHGQTGTKHIYLYIDYSEIPSDGIIDNTDLLWSSTAPTFSATKLGWYNGSDRCIFAPRIVSNNLVEFAHSADEVQYGTFIADHSGALTTSFAATALTIPDLGSLRAQVIFGANYVDGASEIVYAASDTTPAPDTYHSFASADADNDYNSAVAASVITDSSQQIQIKESDATSNTYLVATMGWCFPEGM